MIETILVIGFCALLAGMMPPLHRKKEFNYSVTVVVGGGSMKGIRQDRINFMQRYMRPFNATKTVLAIPKTNSCWPECGKRPEAGVIMIHYDYEVPSRRALRRMIRTAKKGKIVVVGTSEPNNFPQTEDFHHVWLGEPL